MRISRFWFTALIEYAHEHAKQPFDHPLAWRRDTLTHIPPSAPTTPFPEELRMIAFCPGLLPLAFGRLHHREARDRYRIAGTGAERPFAWFAETR
jgi:hypothetical protein